MRTAGCCGCAAGRASCPRPILGLVDITGGKDLAAPQTMALVRAAARLAETELGRIVATSGWARLRPAGDGDTMSIEALGRPDCQFRADGRTQRLSARHSEIMVLLVDHPEGLTGDQLAVELYERDVSMSTVRAELVRLRSLLGVGLLDSRPYRLPPCHRATG